MDSITEVIVTSYNAINNSLLLRSEELPDNFANNFRKNRYVVQRAGDFLLLAEICAQQDEDGFSIDPDEYEKIKTKRGDSIKERTLLFFENREKLIQADEDAWNRLSLPMLPIWDSLREIASSIILLTNKNREAALRQCRFYGLNIQPENLYSGDGGVKKAENFRKIHQRLAAESYDFIDDSIKNLRDINQVSNEIAPVRCHLASWGYLGPNDENIASELGFALIQQKDAVELAKKSENNTLLIK